PAPRQFPGRLRPASTRPRDPGRESSPTRGRAWPASAPPGRTARNPDTGDPRLLCGAVQDEPPVSPSPLPPLLSGWRHFTVPAAPTETAQLTASLPPQALG